VPGAGNTTEPRDYEFIVRDVRPGRYGFRLKQVDFDGAFEYSESVEVSVELPERYLLEEPYPNPFNPVAKIRFAVNNTEDVTVSLYDALGQRKAVLFEGIAAGNKLYELTINGESLASGTYIVRLMGAGFTESKALILLK